MASKQSELIKAMYGHWLSEMAANPEATEAERLGLIEEWNVLSSEPGGVDYLEVDAGGVPALWAVPHRDGSSEAGGTDEAGGRGPVLLALHGGGFISGSRYTHRKMFAHLAKAVGARALIVGYRLLADGGQYPAPVDDVLAAYRWLLDDQGVDHGRIAFTGDSAGGWLTVVSQLRLRDAGSPLPAASMPLSPWIDMEGTGESMAANEESDVLFNREWTAQLAAGFLGGTDPTDPAANALYADLTGLPPMYIQVGGDEMLLDDGRRLAEHAEKAGVEVRLDVFPDQQHTFQMMVGRAPEADDAIARLAGWVRPLLAG
jgi:epsilon-lactone hydrolase